jgi:hypothetical protein
MKNLKMSARRKTATKALFCARSKRNSKILA